MSKLVAEIPIVGELLERLVPPSPIPTELQRWLQVEIQTVVIDSDAPTISISFTKVHSLPPNLLGQWDLSGATQTERTSAILQVPRLALTPYRLNLERFALPSFDLSTVPQLKIGPLTAPTIDLLTIPEVDFTWLKTDPLDALPRKAGENIKDTFNRYAGDWKWTIVKKQKIADILGHGVYLPAISGDINFIKHLMADALKVVIEVSMIPVVMALKLLRDMLIGDWIRNYKRGVDTVEGAINRVVGDLNTQIDNVELYINTNLVTLTNEINTNVAEVQDKVNQGLIKLRDGVVLGQQASQAAIEAANVQGERLEEAANRVNEQLQSIIDYMNDRIDSAFKFVYDAQGFLTEGIPTTAATFAAPTFAILNGKVPTTCPSGYVWDDRLRKCVPITVPAPPPPVEPAPPPPVEPAPPPIEPVPEPPVVITPVEPVNELPPEAPPEAPTGVPALSITSPSSGSVPSAAQTIRVAAKDVAWITLFGSVSGGLKQDFGTQQTGFQDPDEIMLGTDPIGTTTRSFSVSLPLDTDVRFWANAGKFIFKDGAVVKVSTTTSPGITIRYVTAPPAPPPAPVEEIAPGVEEYSVPTPTSIPSPAYELGPVPKLAGTIVKGKVETIEGVAKEVVKQLPKFAALVPLNVTASGFMVLNPGRGSKLTYMAIPFTQ